MAMLQEDVERLLFRFASIGPAERLAHAALDDLAIDPTWPSMSDVDLTATWQSIVRSKSVSFSAAPEQWLDEDGAPFFESCGHVFGVESSQVCELVRQFHDLTKIDRYGIFVLICTSSTFGYIRREFLASDTPIPVGDPEAAYRQLLQRLFDY